MTKQPEFDQQVAHKFFAANCFNKTWDFIDKPTRTPEENQQMILMSHASVWHWTQRPDCSARNISIGYWQLARVYALAGQPDNARRYGQLCLEITPQDDAFCLGFAHEALARAEKVAGNSEQSKKHLADAKRHAEAVADAADKKMLDDDLKTLE